MLQQVPATSLLGVLATNSEGSPCFFLMVAGSRRPRATPMDTPGVPHRRSWLVPAPPNPRSRSSPSPCASRRTQRREGMPPPTNSCTSAMRSAPPRGAAHHNKKKAGEAMPIEGRTINPAPMPRTEASLIHQPPRPSENPQSQPQAQAQLETHGQRADTHTHTLADTQLFN